MYFALYVDTPILAMFCFSPKSYPVEKKIKF